MQDPENLGFEALMMLPWGTRTPSVRTFGATGRKLPTEMCKDVLCSSAE